MRLRVMQKLNRVLSLSPKHKLFAEISKTTTLKTVFEFEDNIAFEYHKHTEVLGDIDGESEWCEQVQSTYASCFWCTPTQHEDY